MLPSPANSGAAAGAIIFLLSYVPYSILRLPVRWNEATRAAKMGLSLFHNTGVCLGCIEISKYELTGKSTFIPYFNSILKVTCLEYVILKLTGLSSLFFSHMPGFF